MVIIWEVPCCLAKSHVFVLNSSSTDRPQRDVVRGRHPYFRCALFHRLYLKDKHYYHIFVDKY